MKRSKGLRIYPHIEGVNVKRRRKGETLDGRLLEETDKQRADKT